jgi:hypothetical protein
VLLRWWHEPSEIVAQVVAWVVLAAVASVIIVGAVWWARLDWSSSPVTCTSVNGTANFAAGQYCVRPDGGIP